jgi:hypothetical protein
MAQVREHAPDLADRVEAIESRDPEAARLLGARMLPRLHEAMRLRDGDPEAFRLRIRELTNRAVVFEAMRAFRDASDAEPVVRTEREQALRAALADQFAIRRETLSRDIDSLSKRLEGMRGDLKKGETEQQALIDRVIESAKEFHDASAPEAPSPRPPSPQ